MVHHEDRPSRAGSLRSRLRARVRRRVGPPDRVEEGGRLEPRLLLLGLRVGVDEEGRAGPHLRRPVPDVHRAQGQPGVHVPVEPDHPDRAPVPAPHGLLVVLDELHRGELGRAGHGDRPGVGEEAVERVEAVPEPPLDVIDGMDEARVHLDLPAADDPHAPRLAHPGLVVAVHVRAHGELRRLLLGGEELEDLLRVADGVRSPRDRPGDGAGLDPPPVHPHVHLRRRGDEVLALPEVHERPVGRGVADAKPAEHLGRRGGAAREERLAGHHLEEIPPPEEPVRLAHAFRVLAGPVVRLAPDRLRRPPRRIRPGSGEAGRRAAARGGEVEAVLLRRRRLVVHDEDRVGKVEDEVAVGLRAGPPELDRVELEREVVAERSIEAETGVVLRAEPGDDGPQGGEDGRLAAPVLLREVRLRLAHREPEGVAAPIDGGHVRLAGKGGLDRREQHLAPLVERAHRPAPPPGHDLERRVCEADVPPGVAAWVLVGRGEQHPAPPVDARGEIRHRVRVEGEGKGVPADLDPPRGAESVLAFRAVGRHR